MLKIRKRWLVTGVVLVASISSMVFVHEVKAEKKVHDWRGNYVGLFIGKASGELNVENLLPAESILKEVYLEGGNNDYILNKPSSSDDSVNGKYFGIVVGRNWQYQNHMVYGLEASLSNGPNVDYSYEWADGKSPAAQKFNVEGVADIKYMINLKGRVGYATGKVLPYLTAGVVYARISNKAAGTTSSRFDGDVDWTTSNLADYKWGRDAFKKRDNGYWGTTLGLGVEYAFTKQQSMKLEYRITKLETKMFDPSFSNIELSYLYHF